MSKKNIKEMSENEFIKFVLQELNKQPRLAQEVREITDLIKSGMTDKERQKVVELLNKIKRK